MDGTNEERFDRWVRSMGGYSGERFRALHREALEFAEPGTHLGYLNAAREFDEAYKRHREAARRAEAAGRAADEAAVDILVRADEIALAADDVLSDPRLPDTAELLGTRPPMGRGGADLELRYALGMANRAPDAYRQMLPDVGDLARTIGVRS